MTHDSIKIAIKTMVRIILSAIVGLYAMLVHTRDPACPKAKPAPSELILMQDNAESALGHKVRRLCGVCLPKPNITRMAHTKAKTIGVSRSAWVTMVMGNSGPYAFLLWPMALIASAVKSICPIHGPIQAIPMTSPLAAYA